MALTPPFATTNDLELRWRPLTSDAERARATALLDDASAVILAEDTRGVLDDLDDVPPILVRVTCAMVARVMATPVAQAPVTQEQRTMGPFAQSMTYANPSGDMYLTKAERRQLGFSRQRAGGFDMFDTGTTEVP